MARKQLKAINRFDIQYDRPQTTIYKDKGSPRQKPPKMMSKVWTAFTRKKR